MRERSFFTTLLAGLVVLLLALAATGRLEPLVRRLRALFVTGRSPSSAQAILPMAGLPPSGRGGAPASTVRGPSR